MKNSTALDDITAARALMRGTLRALEITMTRLSLHHPVSSPAAWGPLAA